MKIKISADSTCDLPSGLPEELSIGIVPLSVVKDGTPYHDGTEISPEDIYAHVESGGPLPSTTAVNMGEYISVFSEYLKEHDAVIHFCISGEMSACCQNARLAAGELKNVYVVDTRSLTTGMGLLALDARRMADKGMDAQDIVTALEEKKAKLDVSFVIDTLKFLHQGGRCSSVAALGANLLSLHPCIEVNDGKMGVGKKYRGSIEKAIMKYLEDRLDHVGTIDTSRVILVNSGGFRPEFLRQVKDRVLELCPFEEVLEAQAGCTISCHCGPKALGILFYRK